MSAPDLPWIIRDIKILRIDIIYYILVAFWGIWGESSLRLWRGRPLVARFVPLSSLVVKNDFRALILDFIFRRIFSVGDFSKACM